MQVMVTQHELQEINELERDVAPMQKRLGELKDGVKVLLIHHMPVELGRFDARLLKRFVRSVPWKKAVVDNLGVAFAEEFRKKFPVHMFCEVMVDEHAVLPLWKSGSNGAEPHVG